MRLRYYAMFFCLGLAACNDLQNGASNAGSTASNEASASAHEMGNILGLNGKPKPPETPKPQPRYCYKTLNDIICYGSPLPGQEERLVAYQDEQGHTGYIMPETTTSPAQLRKEAPLPKTNISSSPDGLVQKNSHLKEIIFDPTELEPKPLVTDKPQ